MAVKDTLRNITFFLIGRIPLINALTLLMLLGERAKRETYPPFEPNMIYGHIGVMVICGLCMGFDMARKPASLIHSGQLLFLAYSIYINDKLKYTEWVKMKMAGKIVGMAGMFLLYAFFNSRKPRNQQLRRIAEILMAMHFTCHVYALIESRDDKKAFLSLVPGGETVLYVYAMLIVLAVLCYLPGFYVVDVTQVVMFAMLAYTLLVDCRIDYWTKKARMDYWNQVRMIVDSFSVLLGMMMFLTCMKRPVYDVNTRKKDE